MEQDLKREARSAVIGAAERLGVDPFRLARFLSDGRLADILSRLRRPHPAEAPESAVHVDLAEQYLDFLDQEIALRRGRSRFVKADGTGWPLD